MNDRFKCIFFNILLCLFGITLCFSYKINSFALGEAITIGAYNGIPGVGVNAFQYEYGFRGIEGKRYCIYVVYNDFTYNKPLGYMYLFSNDGSNIEATRYTTSYNSQGLPVSSSSSQVTFTFVYNNQNHLYYSQYNFGNNTFTSTIPMFTNLNDVENYLINGIMPPLDYNESLNLDTLRVSSWNVGNTLGYHYDFRYKVDTTWSNPDITTVKVRVKGTRKTDDFLGSSSPYSFKFHGYDYANVNGDVVEIIATPYDINGAYGNSLYSSFIYDNLHPLTYIWRKLFKTNDYDNTVEIPYNDPSGNDNVITVPVDGVTNNYTYNIKYNPQTEEITNQYLVDNYYTLVVDYPEDLSGNETIINETQNYLNQYYTTNNYYQTIKDVDVDFDFDFGDISSNDAQGFKTQFDGFFDGLGNFIGKLAKLLVGLAPWLSPAVAVWIVAGFGFLVALLVLLLVIKLVSFVRSLLPF